jgi:hypothetical protein
LDAQEQDAVVVKCRLVSGSQRLSVFASGDRRAAE